MLAVQFERSPPKEVQCHRLLGLDHDRLMFASSTAKNMRDLLFGLEQDRRLGFGLGFRDAVGFRHDIALLTND